MLRFTNFQASVLCVLLFLFGFGSYRLIQQSRTQAALEQQLLTEGFQTLPDNPASAAGNAPIQTLVGPELAAVREQMKINLNTAEAAELNQLPGIGPSTAQNIIDYRKENGPFQTIDDLEKVPRIGAKLVNKIREHVTVGEPGTQPTAEATTGDLVAEDTGSGETKTHGTETGSTEAGSAETGDPAAGSPESEGDAADEGTEGGSASESGDHSRKPEKLTGRIDVNTASASELERLPKIGPSTAKAIVEYRTKNGPFRRAEDLAKVKRVGAKTVDAMRPHITLSGVIPGGASAAPSAGAASGEDSGSQSKPKSGDSADGRKPGRSASKDLAAGQKININTASEAELGKLPGVGPSTAQKIVEHRAVHGPFTKIEDIMKVKGIGKAKFAKMQDHLAVQ